MKHYHLWNARHADSNLTNGYTISYWISVMVAANSRQCITGFKNRQGFYTLQEGRIVAQNFRVMTAVIISRSYDWGAGSVASSIELVKALAALSVESQLLLVAPPNQSCERVEFSRLEERVWASTSASSEAILRFATESRATSLVGSSTPLFHQVAVAARKQDIPYGLIVRGGSPPKALWTDFLLRQAIQNAARVACVAHFLLDALMPLCGRVPLVLRHSAPPMRTNPTQLFGGGHTPTIAYVGQFVRRKQVMLLPDILTIAREILDEEIKLILIGKGPESGDVVAKLRALGFQTIFLGFQHRFNALREINRADFLIFPSTREGRPRVVLEAIANRTIPIATNIPGVREIVGVEASKFLWEPGESRAAGRLIANFHSQPKLRKEFWSLLQCCESIWTQHEFEDAAANFVTSINSNGKLL